MSRFARKISGSLFCLGTILILYGASLLEHFYLLARTKPVEEPILEIALLVLLGALLVALPRKVQPWACGVLVFVNFLWMFADTAYYRFFNDLPSLHLLPTWFQAPQVGSSLGEVVYWRDVVMLAPLLAFAILLVARWKLAGTEKHDPWPLKLSVLLAALWFVSYAGNSVHSVRYQQLQRRFQNKAIWHLFGPYFYHCYDFYEWSRVGLGLEGGRTLDTELVKRVISESRRQSTTDTGAKGRYEGRDFIFVQLESLESFSIDVEIDGRPVAPFLYQANDRVFRFDLFDQTHLGRSADGQFIYLNSIHPPATRSLPFVYPTNEFFGLPKLFAEKGYETFYFEPGDDTFWNSGVLSKSYGFQHRLYRKELPAKNRATDIRGWGLTDRALLNHVYDRTSGTEKPYFAYVVTMMCHHPYSESSNQPVDFPPLKKLSMVTRYLRCVASRDSDLRDFLLRLSATERGRRTVVCLAGDHDANLNQKELKRMGLPVFPEREKVPVLIGTVDEYLGLEKELPAFEPPRSFGGQIDLAPTIGHVFSLNMEESVFVGWNLLATENRGTYNCRLGTWMDQTGTIHESEEARASSSYDTFEVSEMLLQGDKIGFFRTSF